jgi:hypothetical protein
VEHIFQSNNITIYINMSIDKLLLSKQINPSQTLLQITAEEALASIEEMLDDFSIEINFDKLSKEELEKLFFDYADAVVMYHPDSFHQERAAILKNEASLKKCGLTDDNIEELDFD